MKQVKHLLFILVALLTGTLNAGATDWSSSTLGSTISNVSGKSDVYLYNVGTGKFLSAGGHWGSEAEINDYGLPFTVSSSSSGYYSTYYTFTLQNGSGQGLGYSATSNDNYNNVGVFVDHNGGAGSSYTVTAVSSTSYGNVYTISERVNYSTLYLTVKGGTGADKNTVTTTTTSPTDANGYWKFVTKDEMIEEFSKAQASYDNAADATFYIKDADFMRASQTNLTNDVYAPTNWTSDLTAGNTLDATLKYGTSVYYNGSNWYIEGSDTWGPSGKTVNNVEGEYYEPTDQEVTDGYCAETHPTRVHYNALYGKYFCGRIKGNGYITQTITVAKAGTYRLRCQGFTTEEGKAKLYANATGYSIQTGTYTTQTKAGMDLYNDLYPNEVLFEVEEGSLTITITLKVEGASDDAYTCFDKFRLYYLGQEEKTGNLLVLDDQQTTSNEYFTTTTGLGTDGTDVMTLYLRHSGLKATGKWTSIILPVSLSNSQLQAVFGNGVKVAKLSNLDNTIDGSSASNNKIWFQSTTEGIEANVPYIIKPTELHATTNPEAVGYVGNRDENSTDKDDFLWNLAEGDHAGDYFVIPIVKLDKSDTTPETITTDARAGEKASMTGAYVSRTNTVAKGTTLYGFGGGNLYYYNAGKSITFKPFRCWILLDAAENGAKQYSISIDGVEDVDANGTPTMIDDILSDATDGQRFMNNTVYNINGQKVRTNATSLEGLAKGLYIINGKKYVVK